ncbi:MAG: hypothetical protein O3C23_01585 [bacterium]|nr:hypothetical protein [bacterium]
MNKLTFVVVFLGLAFAASAEAADVSVSLRYQDTLVLDAVSFTFPSPGTIGVTDTNGVARSVNGQSVLGILSAIDITDASFAISKMQYFSSYSSLYLQCMTIASLGSEQCDNWLYVVNGVDPGVGMDSKVLTGGEHIYIYYGSSRRVALSSNAVSKGTSFRATAQKYQYQGNTWGQLAGVTIGFTQPNPKNSYSPIEVLTQAVDELGRVSLNLDIPVGDYNVGIKEDYYFPTAKLTVVAPTPSMQSGGGGGAAPIVHHNLDVEKAMQFLIANQSEDGSFSQGALFNDWVAVAFGAYDKESPAKEKLRNYLLLDNNQGTFLTDYERRAMALMALGINPYNGTQTNYIQKIIDEFDGAQFGNKDLVNDDVFALLVLLGAGYEVTDDIIAKTVAFILSYQQENGAFASIDMTAAAAQALVLVANEDGVHSALIRAREYLKSKQENSGGFNDVYATSWIGQAMSALGESKDSWIKNGNTIGDYLYLKQAQDGGVEKDSALDNRLWASAYAVPATLQKSWGDILQNFEKPIALAVAAESEDKLVEDELIVSEAQIEVVPVELAKVEVQALSAQQLESIEAEILLIAKKVDELKPQVALLYNVYLAQLEQSQTQALAQEVSNEAAQLSVLKDGSIALNTQFATLNQKEESKFTAEVAGFAEDFFRSSAGQATLALGVGATLFLLLGGAKAASSFMRRKNTAI